MTSRRSPVSFRPGVEHVDPRTLLSAVVGGVFANRLWPTNQVPYVIDPGVKDAGIIIEAINEYNDQTTMQWVPRTNQSDYVDFEYADLSLLGEAGESEEGHQSGEQFIEISNELAGPSGTATGTVLHEMGHTSGLWHEQQRLDASSNIIINDQNLLPGYASVWPLEPRRK